MSPNGPQRIVVIGSSFTRGFRIEQKDAWPEQLEVVCREAGWDVSVFNRASHGLALSAFAERILQLEQTEPPDMYLLQIPIPSRIYLGVNGTRKLREEDHEKDVILGWSEKSSYVSPTRILLTGGSLNEDSPFHKYLKTFFYPIVKRNNPATTYADFLAYLSFWEANVRDSDLELIAFAKEIVLIQRILAGLGKPFLMFQCCGTCLHRLACRTEPFYPLIDWSAFVRQGEETAFEYLKRCKPDRYEELQNDRYQHLNQAGNRVIAEEFVFPEMERWKSRSTR